MKRKKKLAKKVVKVKKAVCRPAESVQAPPLDRKVPTDPEFSEEWMAEQGLKPGSAWHDYSGEYDKEFCDVRLADGTVIGPCWPNAGKFVRLDHEAEFAGSEVTHVRYYEARHRVRARDEDANWDEVDDGDGDGDVGC
jgi:hypothetical protein